MSGYHVNMIIAQKTSNNLKNAINEPVWLYLTLNLEKFRKVLLALWQGNLKIDLLRNLWQVDWPIKIQHEKHTSMIVLTSIKQLNWVLQILITDAKLNSLLLFMIEKLKQKGLHKLGNESSKTKWNYFKCQ
jgi:hypothetical protein